MESARLAEALADRRCLATSTAPASQAHSIRFARYGYGYAILRRSRLYGRESRLLRIGCPQFQFPFEAGCIPFLHSPSSFASDALGLAEHPFEFFGARVGAVD